MPNPDRILKRTVPVQVPLLPKLAQIVGSTRKDLVPIGAAWDQATEEWRRRFQLQIEEAFGTALLAISSSSGTGTQGPQGETGPTGPRGPTGATGATGPAGADGFQYPLEGGVAASVYTGVPPMDSGTASATFGGVLLDAGGAS